MPKATLTSVMPGELPADPLSDYSACFGSSFDSLASLFDAWQGLNWTFWMFMLAIGIVLSSHMTAATPLHTPSSRHFCFPRSALISKKLISHACASVTAPCMSMDACQSCRLVSVCTCRHACMQRWGLPAEDAAALQPLQAGSRPAWCSLDLSNEVSIKRSLSFVPSERPENVLLKRHPEQSQSVLEAIL